MVLRFACEDMPKGALIQAQINELLLCIFPCLSGEDPSTTLEACKALTSILGMINFNMRNDSEREYILKHICRLSTYQHPEYRHESLKLLCDVAYYYHDLIAREIDEICRITFNAIRQDEVYIGFLGFEFWTIICEREKALIDNGKPAVGYI